MNQWLKLILILNFLFHIGEYHGVSGTNMIYDKFRAIFGSVATLQPYDMDQITSQILNQFNCTQYLGADCYNCLSSSRLQASALIGTTVSAAEFEKVSLIIFCYLMDLSQFCYANSVPDYYRCYNFITNSTNSINANYLETLFKYKIIPNYKVSNYFYPSALISLDSNCIDSKKLVKKYAINGETFVAGNDQINGLFSEIVFMMYNRMKIGCELPYSNWFIDKLFTFNNTIIDYINLNDLRYIMTSLGLTANENESRLSKTFRIIFFNQSTTTNIPLNTTTKQNLNFLNLQNVAYNNFPNEINTNFNNIQIRKRRSVGSNIDEFDKCYSVEQLKEIFSLSDSISRIDFHTISPALIYMKSKGVCSNSANTDSLIVTNAQKYGYGSIAIIVVSLLALLGIFILPCFKRNIYEEILMALTALAVGTLFSDAMLHLLPEVLKVKSDEISTIISVPDFVIKISGAIFALYLFWILETLLHHLAGNKGHSHGHSHNIYPDRSTNNLTSKSEVNDVNQTVISSDPTNYDYYFPNFTKSTNTNHVQKWACNSLSNIQTTGWMILLGDTIHNFADGMAIGASFNKSVNLGVSTTIAVICHEVPHELGNYAVLIKSGFSHLQAMIFNLLSASTSLIGFYIGVSVSADPEVSVWIFAVTAGMFIYLALVDLLPTVMSARWNWKTFIITNIAIITGFLIMFILVIFEDHIQIKF